MSTAYGQITFDAAGTEPRFQCEQEDGRQTIRIGGSPLAVMVSVTGTPVELADYFSRGLAAIRWPDVTVVSDRWAPGPREWKVGDAVTIAGNDDLYDWSGHIETIHDGQATVRRVPTSPTLEHRWASETWRVPIADLIAWDGQAPGPKDAA